MAKRDIWILVADGARARIYSSDGWRRGVSEVPGGARESAVPPGREIASDRPGRSFDRGGEGRHAMEAHTDWRKYEKHQFARQVAELLNDAAARHAFERLVLVAPPTALGELRKTLSSTARDRVVAEINKDLTKASETELARHLEDVVPV